VGAVPAFPVAAWQNLMFFDLRVKFFAEIVGNTINFRNFILDKRSFCFCFCVILLIVKHKDSKNSETMLAFSGKNIIFLIQNSG
jgi:CRISPR/Cas system-associated protein endoribonuclease Cas2